MRKRARTPTTPQRDPYEDMVAHARRGDVRAWDVIVRRYQESVFRVALLLSGEPESAAQTTKATFIRAYRALPDLPSGTPMGPWLIGIATSIARTQRRTLDRWYDRDARRPQTPGEPLLHATPIPWQDRAAALHPDLRDEVRSAFEPLTWDERLAISTRYLLGLSRADAAMVLRMEPPAVERTLHVALEHLRGAIRDARLASLAADHLGWLVIATIVGQARWTPNVAPSVADRLVRDAITYPEQFGTSRRVASLGGLAAIPVEGAAASTSADRR
jgi:RNA polymerase sigma-70 factor (ECF subfamily)